MNYIIMIAVVVALALADWITGFIKGFVLGTISSEVMRVGGAKKLLEIVVMLVGIGLDVAVRQLVTYYPHSEALAGIVGMVCALSVFLYITLMELISILENYAACFPEAQWAIRLTKKLKNIDSANND